ncbi:MAG: hypothetical protein H6707_09275 [Deltaproteobacteria bacterium]|nr:hypothetical protein [Deltaproteobacteria bacterium]
MTHNEPHRSGAVGGALALLTVLAVVVLSVFCTPQPIELPSINDGGTAQRDMAVAADSATSRDSGTALDASGSDSATVDAVVGDGPLDGMIDGGAPDGGDAGPSPDGSVDAAPADAAPIDGASTIDGGGLKDLAVGG